MNPLTLIKIGPYVIAALLALALSIMTNLYMKKRDEMAAFVAQVEITGEQAKKEKEAIEKKHEETLADIRNHYEKLIPAVRAGAVANYKLRYPNSGCSGVSATGSSNQVDDGTGAQSVVADTFIQDCGDDAHKLGAWQAYCIKNNCPVK